MQEALPDIEHYEIEGDGGLVKKQIGRTLAGMACGKIYLQ